MLTNLYLDNVVTRWESEEDIVQYYNTACSIMTEAQFNLRCWASNNHKLTNLAAQDKVDNGSNAVNVLGLQWDTPTDTLSLTCKSYPCCHHFGHKTWSADRVIQGIRPTGNVVIFTIKAIALCKSCGNTT